MEFDGRFVVYLACHNRPIHEVLFPPLHDLTYEFEANFKGMTTEPVELEALIAAREQMISRLHEDLDVDERAFLISLADGKPNWDRMGIDHLSALPAIQWKLQNLTKLRKANPGKFKEQSQELSAKIAALVQGDANPPAAPKG